MYLIDMCKGLIKHHKPFMLCLETLKLINTARLFIHSMANPDFLIIKKYFTSDRTTQKFTNALSAG